MKETNIEFEGRPVRPNTESLAVRNIKNRFYLHDTIRNTPKANRHLYREGSTIYFNVPGHSCICEAVIYKDRVGLFIRDENNYFDVATHIAIKPK